MQVNRETLETLGADLYARVGVPVETALKQAELTMENISHFIVIGGGVRWVLRNGGVGEVETDRGDGCSMPKVQEILMEINGGGDLTKNLNGDETFAMGGAYEVWWCSGSALGRVVG